MPTASIPRSKSNIWLLKREKTGHSAYSASNETLNNRDSRISVVDYVAGVQWSWKKMFREKFQIRKRCGKMWLMLTDSCVTWVRFERCSKDLEGSYDSEDLELMFNKFKNTDGAGSTNSTSQHNATSSVIRSSESDRHQFWIIYG